MKTLMALGIGFFIGQQYTRKYYQQKDQKRQMYLEKKIINIIEDMGGSSSEAEATSRTLISE